MAENDEWLWQFFDDAELIIDLSQQWKLACMHEDSVEIWRAAFNYVLAASKCCLYSRGSSVFGNISSLAFSIESLSYHLHNENWLQLISNTVWQVAVHASLDVIYTLLGFLLLWLQWERYDF